MVNAAVARRPITFLSGETCLLCGSVVQMLRRCVEAMEQARRESASEPKSAYARAATIILNTALADLAALCERGKG